MSSSAAQYEIIKKIGEGGMGVVFLAKDKQLQRLVAIKEVGNNSLKNDPETIERFQREALALAKLNHPNITHIYAFIPYKDYYWMVMEYVEGKTLEEWLKENKKLSYSTSSAIMTQVLEGLSHAHKRGIIHRDVKPANIMINEEGTVKIMDFGVAHMRNVKRLTNHGKSIGTLEYMAPEQIRGTEGDDRTDIYAAGSIFYELICGVPPFESLPDYPLMKAKLEKAPRPISNFNHNTPIALQKVVMKSLERNPEKRFQSAQEFNQEIIKLLGPLLNQKNIHPALKESKPVVKHIRKNEKTSVVNTSLKQSRQKVVGATKSFVNKTTVPVLILIASLVICTLLLLWGMGDKNPSTTEKPLTTNEALWVKDSSTAKNETISDTVDFNETPNQMLDRISKKKDEPANPNEPITKPIKKNIPVPVNSKERPEENESADDSGGDLHSPPTRESKRTRDRRARLPAPNGQTVNFVLQDRLSSEDRSRDGSEIRLTAANDVIVEGIVVIRRGASASGKIVDVAPSGGRKNAVIGFVIRTVIATDGSTIKVGSERFRKISSSPNEAVFFAPGQTFSATVGRAPRR